MHEYGHFAAIGHSKDSLDWSAGDDCNSIMINGQFIHDGISYTTPLQQKCANGPTTTYSADDIEVMKFKEF